MTRPKLRLPQLHAGAHELARRAINGARAMRCSVALDGRSKPMASSALRRSR